MKRDATERRRESRANVLPHVIATHPVWLRSFATPPRTAPRLEVYRLSDGRVVASLATVRQLLGVHDNNACGCEVCRFCLPVIRHRMPELLRSGVPVIQFRLSDGAVVTGATWEALLVLRDEVRASFDEARRALAR